MKEVLKYKDMVISYQIISSKRKTMAIQIKDEGAVIVRTPLSCKPDRVLEFVKAHEVWIYNHYLHQCEKNKNRKEFVWEDGAGILIGGMPVCMNIRSGTEPGKLSVALRDNMLVITGEAVSSDMIKEAVHQWFMHIARQKFPVRTKYWAKIIGVDYGRITIRGQKTRWGSCSGKGNLNFNWKLLMLPEELMDYVIVHELAHRIEMNHSYRFWEIVETILPDYKGLRRKLKDYESQVISGF